MQLIPPESQCSLRPTLSISRPLCASCPLVLFQSGREDDDDDLPPPPSDDENDADGSQKIVAVGQTSTWAVSTSAGAQGPAAPSPFREGLLDEPLAPPVLAAAAQIPAASHGSPVSPEFPKPAAAVAAAVAAAQAQIGVPVSAAPAAPQSPKARAAAPAQPASHALVHPTPVAVRGGGTTATATAAAANTSGVYASYVAPPAPFGPGHVSPPSSVSPASLEALRLQSLKGVSAFEAALMQDTNSPKTPTDAGTPLTALLAGKLRKTALSADAEPPLTGKTPAELAAIAEAERLRKEEEEKERKKTIYRAERLEEYDAPVRAAPRDPLGLSSGVRAKPGAVGRKVEIEQAVRNRQDYPCLQATVGDGFRDALDLPSHGCHDVGCGRIISRRGGGQPDHLRGS